jgi:hypothetical protein
MISVWGLAWVWLGFGSGFCWGVDWLFFLLSLAGVWQGFGLGCWLGGWGGGLGLACVLLVSAGWDPASFFFPFVSF